MLSKLQLATLLDLVCDRYIIDSLKGTARAKQELFSFLSGILHDSFQLADKELVITEGDDGLRKPPLLYTSALAPCNHEEVNSRTMLHAAYAAYKKILIRAVDTDVVVLAVALAGTLKEEIEVWVSISTGKSFCILAAHEIARAVGRESTGTTNV